MDWWKLIYWAIGFFGVAGTICLIVFLPAAATAVGNALARFFGFVLGYRVGCALVAAVLAWFIADYVRHSIEDDKHAAEVAAFEQKQDERDERIKRETRDEVLSQIAAAKVEDAKTDKDVKDFTDALPKPPETGNPFAVGADACRLRRIAGQAECGRRGAQGVPQAHPTHGGVGDRATHGLPSLVRRSLGRDAQRQ